MKKYAMWIWIYKIIFKFLWRWIIRFWDNQPKDMYYHNGHVIGSCDLFIYKGVVKIEDFAVIPKYQCKGYWTTILKILIEIEIKKKCYIIYVVTDEEDTVKEMYKKLNLIKY